MAAAQVVLENCTEPGWSLESLLGNPLGPLVTAALDENAYFRCGVGILMLMQSEHRRMAERATLPGRLHVGRWVAPVVLHGALWSAIAARTPGMHDYSTAVWHCLGAAHIQDRNSHHV